jgi:hypothetical protein
MKETNHTHFSLSIAIIISLTIIFSGCMSKTRRDMKIAQAVKIAQEKKKISGLPEDTPDPSNTISEKEEKKIIDISKDETELTPPTPIEGNLIQTGGIVAQLATQLTIDLDVSGSNVSQIVAMQKFVQNRWHYIHDPARSKDTWRSAEATIKLRHNGKFPGDCDDFAILMASLAKQIGLESRMVGGTYNGGGHAWAEFKLEPNEKNNPSLRGMDIYKYNNGYWVSLDWFKGQEHKRYTKNIRIYNDI